jgi:hypothetical protein
MVTRATLEQCRRDYTGYNHQEVGFRGTILETGFHEERAQTEE